MFVNYVNENGIMQYQDVEYVSINYDEIIIKIKNTEIHIIRVEKDRVEIS